MSQVRVFSETACILGEGPLWHPERGQLFWFDILGKRLLTKQGDNEHAWDFEECHSAAGWVDQDTLLIASETGLYRFDIPSGARERVVSMEEDNPVTRSNDGRADPWGGFWIGTMGYKFEPKAGAIYRYYRGELRKIVPDVTISNAICFAPDRSFACYVDTPVGKIMKQPLDPETGWPTGTAEVFLDLSGEAFGVDGAVMDQDGCLWNAQWQAARVVRYGPEGGVQQVIDLPTPQTTCPAFGGPDLSTLYVTSAAENVNEGAAGQTFVVETGVRGQAEHRVIL